MLNGLSSGRSVSGVLVLLPPTHSCPCTSPTFSFSLLIKNQCPFPLRPGKVDTQMETQQLPFTPRPGQNSDRVREVGAASSFSPPRGRELQSSAGRSGSELTTGALSMRCLSGWPGLRPLGACFPDWEMGTTPPLRVV